MKHDRLHTCMYVCICRLIFFLAANSFLNKTLHVGFFFIGVELYFYENLVSKKTLVMMVVMHFSFVFS